MHIMIDLETMGTRPNAPIISIGAVAFDKSGTHTEFYDVVDLKSTVHTQSVIDADTVMWWMKQSDEARAAFDCKRIDIGDALSNFQSFCGRHEYKAIWGNGAAFDNVILSEAYLSYNYLNGKPWDFWEDRCYRTVKNMFPDVAIERGGTHHNALDDARSQAEHLIAINAVHGNFL